MVNVFEYIKNLLIAEKKLKLEKARIYKYNLTYNTLKTYLTKKFPECYTEIVDVEKRACDYETLKELAKDIPAKFEAYVAEDHDCEDFAREAWGFWSQSYPRLAVGLCFVDTPEGKHAVNCAMYTNQGKHFFTFIEPQTGQLTANTKWKPYLMII